MTTVIMPKMGDGMEEGTLLEWTKKEGEQVKSGEIIGTIQTDKATLELESPGTGVLKGVLVNAGQTVPVGRPIAAILGEGESLPNDWSTGTAPAAAAVSSKQEEAPPPKAQASAPVHAEPAAAAPKAPPSRDGSRPAGERVKASPLAKRIARDMRVDIATLEGSGPGGRIVEKDVRSAAEKGPAPQRHLESPQEVAIPLNKLRQITAQRTAQSKREVPHFYVTVECDLDRLMELRELFERDGSKLSINDFVMRACALALREMPIVNSSFEGQTLKQHGQINIGMAVALEDGLTLPVVHNADQLTVRELSAKTKELAQKARENKLNLEELSGHTFSISNMGMLNVDDFSAIIVQPDAGILAIASARKKAVVGENDQLEVRWQMNITGAFDHRVVDGAVGARFVNLVRQYLENPTRLL